MINEDYPVKFWMELYFEKESNPCDSRTDKEFCEEIKLDYGTLTAWRRRDRDNIYREVEKRRKSYVNELRAKGHKALMKKLDKDTNAIKLLFQLLGDLVEKSEVRTEQMTDADKLRRVKSLLSKAVERKGAWDNASEKAKESSVPADERPTAPELGGIGQEAANLGDGKP